MTDNPAIDFVITWVDGSDLAWQAQKRLYEASDAHYVENSLSTEFLSGDMRYRNWDLLRYWFRGIAENAPWVRYIHFVTWGHLPKWLNVNHPKLRIVEHRDFIPPVYLPTFNSHAIEFNMHRIPGLSEQFVYFNDDTFLLRRLNENDVFENGVPKDTGVLMPLIPKRGMTTHYQVNAVSLINAHYSKNQVISIDKGKWFNRKYGFRNVLRTALMQPYNYFSGFLNPHLPLGYLKSTFEEVWNQEADLLDSTCRNKFRSNEDVSTWVLRYWQLASGKFSPRSPSIGANITAYNNTMLGIIENRTIKMICVNDLCQTREEFEYWQPRIQSSFATAFPNRCEFEI